jgi:hypothetical protein
MKNRNKIISFSFLFAGLFFLFSFQSKDPANEIAWSKDRPLTWKDFKGVQPKDSKFAALTDWNISFTCSGENDSMKTEVVCFFGERESKVKQSAKKDSVLLKHEQYHFNLGEVYTRKFRKALGEARFSKRNAANESAKLYKQYFDECHDQQDLYDKETEHSIKTDKQKEWELKIDKELSELEKYTWKTKSFLLH